MIVVGTSIGSILRKLSKMAQAQTAKAMEVGEEAISNVRTVRNFAMEEYEIDRYSQEVDKASKMNEWLGFGIGIFQAGTVLFLNGIVLSTLYYGNLIFFFFKVVIWPFVIYFFRWPHVKYRATNTRRFNGLPCFYTNDSKVVRTNVTLIRPIC